MIAPLIIGDVHGLVDKYWKVLQNHNGPSIQVGDFGFSKQHDWHLKHIDSNEHKINFGNHDDYTYLNKPHSLGNWSFDVESGIMTIRGAFSIDRAYRTEGKDWWSEEEMTYPEMQEVVDAFILHKPVVVVSHDAPHEARRQMFNIYAHSITSNGLQVMFEQHQPTLWLFGHHHQSTTMTINGTRFICLDELETYQL